MVIQITESLTKQRRSENLRNSTELGGQNILNLGPTKRDLALRLVAFTRVLNPKLAAQILKGTGLDIDTSGFGDLPSEKED